MGTLVLFKKSLISKINKHIKLVKNKKLLLLHSFNDLYFFLSLSGHSISQLNCDSRLSLVLRNSTNPSLKNFTCGSYVFVNNFTCKHNKIVIIGILFIDKSEKRMQFKIDVK